MVKSTVDVTTDVVNTVVTLVEVVALGVMVEVGVLVVVIVNLRGNVSARVAVGTVPVALVLVSWVKQRSCEYVFTVLLPRTKLAPKT